MKPFNWECPYCGKPTTITSPHIDQNFRTSQIRNSILGSYIGIGYTIISCPNKDCKSLTVNAAINKIIWVNGNPLKGDIIKSFSLLPESHARPQPEYIPEVITEDYYEACRICNLSPKASATLSRRCLQGMIRDFWGIKMNRLVDEIKALKDKVDGPTWEAIDSVREIGNIGAHMEKDVNLIIEVEPDEAEILINLIETLFKEWYVAKYQKEQNFSSVVQLAKEKKEKKNQGGKFDF
ncbi:MAG: DUF4145 domain-containing protein [Candidatus Nitronauta litoralis]|uniref:DUF4145 domain-containing protein n=1 Tax=Candidatus Nitronauta litoralis TaxID=2705533 RepID=A0A7T0BWB8_9BACT|nr:MAG: DUF4145 domain-containing protein [Candidatus Nitronauta litoralis]